MKIEVLFFANLRELAGARARILTLPGEEITLQQLRQRIANDFPALSANLDAALAAINEDFAFAEDIIRDGDRVAFFPPVSGGSEYRTHLQLAEGNIDHNEILRTITSGGTGAICLFSGVVRGVTFSDSTSRITPHHETRRLDYEAYAPMAESKLRQVATEIRTRWPAVQGIAIVQRLGELAVGEATVLIACASAHRDSGCFEAARYGIDRLKEIVPIWKKEIGKHGEVWIEGNYIPQKADRQNE